MNKVELIKRVSADTGLMKKDCTAIIDSMLSNITTSLEQGEKVQIVGFGTFEVRHRGSRVGRNINTKELFTIPSVNTPAFKPGKNLKERVTCFDKE